MRIEFDVDMNVHHHHHDDDKALEKRIRVLERQGAEQRAAIAALTDAVAALNGMVITLAARVTALEQAGTPGPAVSMTLTFGTPIDKP